MSDTRASAEIVKGSWEDLLLQAGTLADQDDEEASRSSRSSWIA